MIRTCFRCLILVFLFVFSVNGFAVAQPQLPDLMVVPQNGVNVLSWTCQYDRIKSIAVQRSNDSFYNFTTIGYVKDLKKGPQAFIDGHPAPGDNWYRLYIVFSSDLIWYSNNVKSFIDSSQLMQKGVLPPNDSLQSLAGSITFDNSVPDASELNAYTYIRSQYVFTNPFTGHINVELPDNDDRAATYSLRFFDQQDKMVMDVSKVAEHSVVIDKRNFQRKGIYKFELRKGKDILETGYVTVY